MQNSIIDGIPVIGDMNFLNNYEDEAFVVCSLGVASKRELVIEKIKNPNIHFATLVDPDANVYKDSTIGEGSIICGGSILAINTQIGKHVIVNLDCTLGHDAIIGDYCVINPGTNVSGKVKLSERSNLGTGTKVIQGLSIGSNTTVGAGAVIITDIPSNCVAVGVPAKPVKFIQ